MSALLRASFAQPSARERTHEEFDIPHKPGTWNPETFAREQIRGLVRQVFFGNGKPPVRQVMLSAVEPEAELCSICRRIGETLAKETQESVAVVGAYPRLPPVGTWHERLHEHEVKHGNLLVRESATHVRGNLWLIPHNENGNAGTAASIHSCLGELRRQFEYSIVQGPPAGASDAAVMALFADGVILVLSANRTRRATARKIKATLEAVHARILGAVLNDRVFPIPEAIYRRL